MIYLDTHVIAWLYAKGPTAVPAAARQLIEETDDIRISPMVRLEMQYLFEIARVAAPASTVLDELTVKIGLRICDAPFLQVIQETERQPWTRDPFDRLIVAQASLHGAVLITKDDTISDNYAHTIWDKPQAPEISSDA